MKPFIVLGLTLASVLLAESPAVRVASGPYGHTRSSRKIYESPRILAQANAISTEDLKMGIAVDPGLQIKLATQTNDLLLNFGPRWFIAERDYLFTRSEVLPMFGLKIQLEGRSQVTTRDTFEQSPDREVSSRRQMPFGFEKR